MVIDANFTTGPRFEVYPVDIDGFDSEGMEHSKTEFYWRFRASNGQITAIGREGFTRHEDAHRAVIDFCRSLGLAFDGPGRPPECHNVIPPILDVDE